MAVADHMPRPTSPSGPHAGAPGTRFGGAGTSPLADAPAHPSADPATLRLGHAPRGSGGTGLVAGIGTGIGTGVQARLDAGLMQARLPRPVLVYLICVVLPLWFSVGPLLLSALRLFLLVMLVPAALRLMRGAAGRIILTDVLFLAHVIWQAVALAANNPDQVISQTGSTGVEFLGGYLMGRAYIRRPEDFLALIRWVAFLVLCLAPFAVYETMTGRPILIDLIQRLPGMIGLTDINNEKRMGLERVQVVFAHPIHFGLFCSVAFSLVFVGLKGVVSTPRRWITSALVAATGFLALSSGALLALALQVALIAWAAAFARVQARWWILVGLFVLAYVVIDVLSTRDPLRVFMSYATFSAGNAFWRAIIFEWGMKSVWGSPIFGIGLKDWVRPVFMVSPSVDNFWLVMAMRYGIPGFLLITAGYVLAIARIMRRNFSADPVLAQIRLAWVFTFLGLSFTLATVHIWTSIYSFVFFMFGAGIWLIAARPDPGPAASSGPAPPAPPAPPSRRGPRYSRFPAAVPPRRRAAPA